MTAQRDCPGHHTTERPAPGLRDGEHLCRSCVHRTELLLTDIAGIVADLERTTIARTDRVQHAGGQRRGVPEQDWRGQTGALVSTPWPANVDAAARARTVLELLFEWADHVAGWHRETGLPPFARHVPLRTLTGRACAILTYHSKWMVGNEQGPDLANAVWCVRRDLRKLADTQPGRLYAGPCQAELGYDQPYRCGAALYRQWGQSVIRCDGHRPSGSTVPAWSSGCGAEHEEAGRREFLRASVDEALLPLRLLWGSLHALVGQPASDVAWKVTEAWTRPRSQRVESINPKTGKRRVRVVTTPPRLSAAGLDWQGEPLYRGADVLALVEDSAARRRRVRRVTVA